MNNQVKITSADIFGRQFIGFDRLVEHLTSQESSNYPPHNVVITGLWSEECIGRKTGRGLCIGGALLTGQQELDRSGRVGVDCNRPFKLVLRSWFAIAEKGRQSVSAS